MNILKKFISLCTITLSITSFVWVQPTYAQADSSAILAAIKQDTGNILSGINQLPTYLDTYLNDLTKMAKSWLGKDDSNIIANNQGSFIQLKDAYSDGLSKQLDSSKTLTQQYLAASLANATTLQLDPYNESNLSYSAAIGSGAGSGTTTKQNAPNAQNNQANSASSYIKYAAGANFWLPQANPAWKKSPDKTRYQNFFYSLAAVQSYSSYILSGLLNQQSTDKTSKTLIDQATSSDFFLNITSESLGPVLRQILMYNAQTYVLLNRMLKLQQQQLASLAMTNSLLITMGSSMVGQQLYTRAQSAS